MPWQARMARSRKPDAIKWSRFRRHNLKLFLKPFCWTRRQAKPGSCITKRGRLFNGFPFGFRLERTGLRLSCRRHRTPLGYRAERRPTPIARPPSRDGIRFGQDSDGNRWTTSHWNGFDTTTVTPGPGSLTVPRWAALRRPRDLPPGGQGGPRPIAPRRRGRGR